jgi:hypothetical protein
MFLAQMRKVIGVFKQKQGKVSGWLIQMGIKISKQQF